MLGVESNTFPGPRPFFFGGWVTVISPCGIGFELSPVRSCWSVVRFLMVYLTADDLEVFVFRGAIFDVLTTKQTCVSTSYL